jgi:hypothetical protein
MSASVIESEPESQGSSFQTPFIHPEDDSYYHQPILSGISDNPLRNIIHNIFQESVWNTSEEFYQLTISFDTAQMIPSPNTMSNPYTIPHAILEVFFRETLASFGWTITTKTYISGVIKPTITPETSPMAILLRDTRTSPGELWVLTYDSSTNIWRYHGTQEYPLVIDPNVYLDSLDSSIIAIYMYDGV